MKTTGIMASPAVIRRIRVHKTGSQVTMPMKQGMLQEDQATARSSLQKVAAAKAHPRNRAAIAQAAATAVIHGTMRIPVKQGMLREDLVRVHSRPQAAGKAKMLLQVRAAAMNHGAMTIRTVTKAAPMQQKNQVLILTVMKLPEEAVWTPSMILKKEMPEAAIMKTAMMSA